MSSVKVRRLPWKIVVLDGATLNPGDLSWERLERLGELTVHERTPPSLIAERCAGAQIVFTNKTPLDGATLAQLTELKYIGVLATGYNVVDIQAAGRCGIVITNVPMYGTRSVAQMVFALLLELCHHTQKHSDAVREGRWSAGPNFCFWDYPLVELDGKTIGIVGFGRIGRCVARIADAFGMRVLAAGKTAQPAPNCGRGVWTDVPQLLRQADVISLHCPLTPGTEGLINKATIELMKADAMLINTSRGGLVNDGDLAAALNSGRIAGAGLDVLSVEPPPADNPLLTAKNCIITPHISWATREARTRLMETAVANLEAFLSGSPTNVIEDQGGIR